MVKKSFLAKLLGEALLVIVFSNLLFFPAALPSPSSSAEAEKLAMESGITADAGQCDIFSGEWIPDPGTPPPLPYDSSCSFVPDDQNCRKNGRPDTSYENWKWKPFGCDLPQVDTAKFLDAIKNKGILFIGESVVHNQMSSLACILSQVEEPILVYHDKRGLSKTWHLPVHNITLGLIWSPFLLASTQEQSYVDMLIWLNALDKTWTDQYPKYDYILFTGGQWFMKETIIVEKDAVIGCHNCPGKDLKELGYDYPFRKALRLAFQFMSTSDHRPLIIYRSWAPVHYENGASPAEGHCNKTQPFKEGEYILKRADTVMRNVEKEEFESGLKAGLRLKLLDVFHLSLLRPDGHPGTYLDGNFQPNLTENPRSDCQHWCSPGVPDTWNQMLMNIILGEEILRYVS